MSSSDAVGAQMFRSLRHRNARLFFAGLAVSNVGTWMQLTAMSLVVYRLTGKATDVGITLFCQFLPMLVLGVWAGAVADRVDKRRMAMLTQSALAVQALVLGAAVLAGSVSLPLVYALSLVMGVVNAFDNPARRGFVIELVEPDDISNVVSLNTAVMTGSRIFGPALAAVLIDPLGAGWLFIINGVSFVAILWSIAVIDGAALHRAPPAPRGGTPVRDSLRFVRRNRRLLVLFVVFTVVGTFAFNYNVSLLKLVDDRFGRRNLYGWLLAVTSIGNLAGSLLTAALRRVRVLWFLGAAAVMGVSGLGLAWAPSIWVGFACAIPLGAGGAAFIASLNAITQAESPPDMRGRLLALGAVAFLGTTPIGAPITGWVADRVSAEWSLAYGSVTAIAGAAAGALVLRRRSQIAQVPADQHEPAAVHVDHADRRGLVVESGPGGGV
jgi:MFS family permease